MATFQDAQAGWAIFKEFDFTLSLDEINARLMQRGFAPVAPRTFAHYDKLRRFGYEHYIPINQLDVKTLQNPVWDVGSRNRYPIVEARLPVRVVIHTSKESVEFPGHSINISEGTLAIRVRRRAALTFFGARTRWKNSPIDIIFGDTGEIERSIIDAVTLDESGGGVNLRVSFDRLVPLEGLLEREALAPSEFRIVVGDLGDDNPFASVVEDLWWLLQALESSRAICQEILVALDSDNKFLLPTTRIRHLSLNSPLDVLLDGNLPQVLLVYFGLKGLVRLQGDYWSARLKKEEALEKRAANRSRDIRPLLDPAKLAEAITRVIHDLLVKAKSDPSRRKVDQERITSLVEKHLQRSLEGLLEDEADVEIDLTSEAAQAARKIEDELQNEESDSEEEEEEEG